MTGAEFVIARNPDPDSTLRFLIRVPLESGAVVLKARDSWPRTAKVFCHQETTWPDDAEILERVPVRSCVRRGAAIDLVLARGRENRSQIVFTRIRGGREAIFWQTARTAKQAKPNVGIPHRRSVAGALNIVVDSHEQYPWRFADQQATTERRALVAGDYGVELDGVLVASVERKSLTDLVATLLGGRLRYLLADLAALPRAALVVEERWSSVFRLERARPAVVADGLAEAQVRFPSVPIVFCETRPLAQEWAYRFLGAALAELSSHSAADALASGLTLAPEAGLWSDRKVEAPPAKRRGRSSPEASAPQSADAAIVRAWAVANGFTVSARGRLAAEVQQAFQAAGPQARA